MNFFVLEKRVEAEFEAGTEFFGSAGGGEAEAPRCRVCGNYIGMIPLAPPIRIALQGWGQRWGDIGFGPGNQLLLSDKCKMLFEHANMQGFLQFDPVEVVKILSNESAAGAPPKYWLGSIALSVAAIDALASGLVRGQGLVCPACRTGGTIKRIARIALESGSWKGEDVFIARGLPGTILVSERFEQLCSNNHLTNCHLIPAEEFSFDFYPLEHQR